MAYREVCATIKYPEKTSARYKRLDGFDRLRLGTLYEAIKTPFDEEEEEGGQYIPIRKRRPSLIWRGAQMLTDQLSGLLWGDEQMPVVRTYDGDEPSDADIKAEQTIQHIVENLNLDAVMDDATRMASSGSAAIVVRNTDDTKEAYIEVLPGKECTPKFDPRNPMLLLELEQKYPTTGQDLADLGYKIDDDDLGKAFWFRLVIDAKNETRFKPMTAERYEHLGEKDKDGKVIAWEEDEDNTWAHGWPVTPVIWLRAPGQGSAQKIDGDCLYGAVADIFVGIDYDLSQLQRGYRYTADPLLAIKRGELANAARPAGYQEPSNIKRARSGRGSDGRFSRNAATRIIEVEPGGEAKWLEISGQALKAFEDLVKTLREWGLEICGGMKSDSENTKGVESGRALEILFQSLILVVKRWRVALGNKGFLPLVTLLLVGIDKGLIVVPGIDTSLPTDTIMRLVWPQWITPSGQDLVALANAAETLAGGSPKVPVPLLPRDLVTRYVAANLGQTDTSSIVKELDKQTTADAADADAAAQQEHKQSLELVGAKSAASPSGGAAGGSKK